MHSKTILKSFFNKYTIVGSFLNLDRKYLLKEFAFFSIYAVALLKINKITFWPIAVVFGAILVQYTLFEIIIKKYQKVKIEDYQNNRTKNHINADSELDVVDSVCAEIILSNHLAVKKNNKVERSSLEITSLFCMSLLTLLLFCQTIMTLILSISNSGQINIISFFILIAVDQIVLRPLIGFTYLGSLLLI